MKRVALGLVLAVALGGCSSLRSEGEESLVVRNSTGEPLTVVLSITQQAGDIMVFGESMGLGVGEAREFALALRTGAHTVALTTSNRLQEALALEVPDHGDTHIEIVVRRGGATMTTTS